MSFFRVTTDRKMMSTITPPLKAQEIAKLSLAAIRARRGNHVPEQGVRGLHRLLQSTNDSDQRVEEATGHIVQTLP
jgi:hypothetical protein